MSQEGNSQAQKADARPHRIRLDRRWDLCTWQCSGRLDVEDPINKTRGEHEAVNRAYSLAGAGLLPALAGCMLGASADFVTGVGAGAG